MSLVGGLFRKLKILMKKGDLERCVLGKLRHDALKKPLTSQVIEVVGRNDKHFPGLARGRRRAGTGENEANNHRKKAGLDHGAADCLARRFSAVIHYHPPLSFGCLPGRGTSPTWPRLLAASMTRPCGRTDKGDEACRPDEKSLTGDF